VSKALKVGLIGAGGIAGTHIGYLKKIPDVEVVALCDVREEAARKTAEKFEVPKVFSSYKDILKLKDVDAVSVCTPNYFHAEPTIAALKAGKHVMCEKPMAMNTAEAKKMRDTAKRLRKLLMMHFNMRYMTTAATLKPIIDTGALGRIYHVTTTYTRRDGYPRPGSWFGQKAQSGGGPLIDLGVHRIDLALWLIGYPKPVAAFGGVYDLLAREKLKGIKFDCEDFSAAMIRFADGCTMYCVASWDGHEKAGGCTMSIRGTDGAIFEEGAELTLCRKEFGVPTACVLAPQQPKESPQQHFVDCILSGKQPGPSAEHGVTVMKILDAIYASARTGREARIR